jgi:outer membrane protein insertion porin family
VGNETVNSDTVIADLQTRKDRLFDPETVQADKRRLISAGRFREVRIYTQHSEGGVVVTFEVFERPTIHGIRFIGDRAISQKKLLRESGLEVGDALSLYAIQEARRKIEDFYHTQGFPKATVNIQSGDAPEDREVVFEISEGPLQRLKEVKFVGNSFVSAERLKIMVKSKPGILGYFFRGKVDSEKIEEDVETLTAYYRSFGFFNARISRKKEYDEDQSWLTLVFVIDEGPRYVVDNVSVIGNSRFDTASLLSRLNLNSGDYFNLAEMNKDVSDLRDLYGSQGHIFANIEASPRYLIDQPGKLDLVYNIEEGERFRVGRINVLIAGEYPHTRESTVRDRLSLRTGDIVDIREVRASERRLKYSQLFEDNPANGKSPRIVIRPPQLSDADELMSQGGRSTSVRGQSPGNER